jgi:hypothetical protein
MSWFLTLFCVERRFPLPREGSFRGIPRRGGGGTGRDRTSVFDDAFPCQPHAKIAAKIMEIIGDDGIQSPALGPNESEAR